MFSQVRFYVTVLNLGSYICTFVDKQYSTEDKIVGCGTGLSGDRISAAPFIVCVVFWHLPALWSLLPHL